MSPLIGRHYVVGLHTLCIKLKNLTKWVQGILNLRRIVALFYSIFKKAFFFSHANQNVLRRGQENLGMAGGEVGSSISKEQLSFNGPLETHLQGQDQTVKSEMSSPTFLYLLLVAISETKSLISNSCLKCVSLLKEI